MFLTSLLLGVATSLGIAWGCAGYHAKQPKTGVTSFRRMSWFNYEAWVKKGGVFGLRADLIEHSFGSSTYSGYGYQFLTDTPELRTRLRVPPIPWNVIERLAYLPGTHIVRMAGWPVPCVWGFTVDTAPAGNLRPLPELDTLPLPMRPNWRGLLIDSSVFGAGWLLLIWTPWQLRRFFRFRRDRCLWCGYDLRGLAPVTPCPECGTIARRHTRTYVTEAVAGACLDVVVRPHSGQTAPAGRSRNE